MIRPLLVAGLLAAASAGGAVAAEGGRIGVEFNDLQQAEGGCRAVFVLNDGLGKPVDKLTLRVVSFDKKGTRGCSSPLMSGLAGRQDPRPSLRSRREGRLRRGRTLRPRRRHRMHRGRPHTHRLPRGDRSFGAHERQVRFLTGRRGASMAAAEKFRVRRQERPAGRGRTSATTPAADRSRPSRAFAPRGSASDVPARRSRLARRPRCDPRLCALPERPRRGTRRRRQQPGGDHRRDHRRASRQCTEPAGAPHRQGDRRFRHCRSDGRRHRPGRTVGYGRRSEVPDEVRPSEVSRTSRRSLPTTRPRRNRRRSSRRNPRLRLPPRPWT